MKKMPSIDVPGARLHYEVTGAGPALVLIHGSATDSGTWSGIVESLAGDHRVVTYDRRGYGQSTHEPVRDHRVHTRDFIAVLEQVVREPAKVVGWSAGGNIALAAAVERPDLIDELVVIEPPFHGLRHADRPTLAAAVRLKLLQAKGRPEQAAEVFFRFASALKSGGNSYDLLDRTAREELLRNAGPVLAEWDPHPYGIMMEHISTKAVSGLSMPVRWVLGGESASWINRLHDRVLRRKPDIDSVVVEGAGHLVHLDRPYAFLAAVRGSDHPGLMRPSAGKVRTAHP